jgi:hypothetical protein
MLRRRRTDHDAHGNQSQKYGHAEEGIYFESTANVIDVAFAFLDGVFVQIVVDGFFHNGRTVAQPKRSSVSTAH